MVALDTRLEVEARNTAATWPSRAAAPGAHAAERRDTATGQGATAQAADWHREEPDTWPDQWWVEDHRSISARVWDGVRDLVDAVLDLWDDMRYGAYDPEIDDYMDLGGSADWADPAQVTAFFDGLHDFRASALTSEDRTIDPRAPSSGGPSGVPFSPAATSAGPFAYADRQPDAYSGALGAGAAPHGGKPGAPHRGPLRRDPTMGQRFTGRRRGASKGALRRASRYSRFVTIMKWLLPLGAVAIVVAVLAFTALYEADDQLTLTFAKVERVNDDLRMVQPRFASTDADDNRFVVTAETALQSSKDPGKIRLETLQADIALDRQRWVSISALSGEFDSGSRMLRLNGNINLYSDQGYEFHTETALADVNKGTVTGDQEIKGLGPLGRVRADGFEVTGRGAVITFKGNVSLTINPEASSATPAPTRPTPESLRRPQDDATAGDAPQPKT